METRIRATLEAAGFTLVDPVDPDRAPMQPAPPGKFLVRDRAGGLRTATTAQIAPGTWPHLLGTLQRLVEEPHEHVVRLHDAFPLLDDHGYANVAEGEEPRDLVLVWELAEPGRTLGAFVQNFELDAWQVSAALVGCARGLVFLSACGLGLPEDWRIEDVHLGDAGHIQILPASICPAEPDGPSGHLSRIAESGLHLLRWLEGVPPPLRDLLNRTVQDRHEVPAGTFAAKCHDLLEPVAPEGWEPRPLTSEADDEAPDVLRTWRAHVLRSDPDSGPLDVEPRRSTRQAIGRKGAPVSRLSLPGRTMRRARDGSVGRRMVLIGAAAASALLAGIAWGPRFMPEPTTPGPSQAAPAQSLPPVTDPRDAAFELTAERVSILASLSETQPTDASHDEMDVAALARVLIADSTLMRQDRDLVSRLRTQPAMSPVRVERGLARTLSRSKTKTVVEVNYVLVADDGSRFDQEATLGLVMTPDGWRVSQVGSAALSTDRGNSMGAHAGSAAADPTRR